MTQEQYNKSIETGELQLDAWGKLSYFFLVGFLFFIPLILLAFDLFDRSKNYVPLPIWVAIIFTVLAILLYRVQKIRLKFQIVETRLNKRELLNLIKQVSDELKWTPFFEEGDIFVIKTSPEYFSGIVNEQITVLFNNGKVLINCVCDLDRKSSFDLMGHNKKTVSTLIDRIDRAEKNKTL